ncbi:MAG: DUF5671 domain-containing protein [Sphaerobacter sp.]|nr:DUF5671 domain-containing protein [Sphaerobacter sp.]
MRVVRPIYLYFIAAVALAMLASGLMDLLRIALEQASLALGDSLVIVGGDQDVRRELSRSVALSVVALPVWLLHWWLAERAALRPDLAGEAERRSLVRALFLTAVLAGSFTVSTIASVLLVERLVVQALGGAPGPDSLAANLATLLVAGTVWAYHARVRREDTAAVAMTGAAVWVPRLYRYAAAFTGALLLIFGLAGLLGLLVEVLVGRDALVAPSDWWHGALAGGVARTAVGLVAWAGHWTVSLRRLRQPGWLGADERASILRRTDLYLLILVGVVGTLSLTAIFLNNALQWLLGVTPDPSAPGQAQRLLEPLAWALPFVATWAYHRWILLGEARGVAEAPLQATARRIYTYGVALVGLGFGSVGVAYLLGLLIDRVLGGSRTLSAPPDWFPRQVALFASFVLVGLGAWLWHWYAAARRVADDPAAERGALVRRISLFATLAAALVALLGSLAVTLYRVLTVILGVESARGLVSDVSAALGVLVVAVALLAYHASALRADLRERRPPPGAAATLPLLLTGPPGADLTAVLAELQARLPDGYALRPLPERKG